ncbi:MAG: glycosyltransferase [Pseudomonadota bacterium]
MSLPLLVFLGLWLLNWAILGWGTWLAFKQLRKTPEENPAANLPPVSILKPLKGADEGLTENLQSFFNQNYPKYEILFSVTDPGDPAIPVVEKLMSQYPLVNAKLHCFPQAMGPNPKINNLMTAYEEAQNDIVLISDSNIRVKADYLLHLVPDLKDSVGIITAVVAGISPSGLGGWLEASYLNTFFARWMVLTKKLGFPSVVGKSMVFRKTHLKRVGGLSNLAHYIAEDYMAGHAMEKLDLKIEFMRSPIEQYIGVYSYEQFWGRHLRWGRIRKSIAPFAFLIEPLFFSTVSGFLGAWALSSLFGASFFQLWILHMIFWAFCDALIYQIMDRFSLKAMGAWFIRECLAPVLWFSILSGNTVFWRGREYKILQGGLLAKGPLV